MSWIKVNKLFNSEYQIDMPKHEKPFLSIWKGRICLTQYDIGEDRYYICFDPADFDLCLRVSQNRNNSFYYWMELPKEPDYE